MKGRAGAHTVPLSEWSKQDFPMFRRFAFIGTARLPIRAPNGVSVRMEWEIPPHSGTSDQRVIWADQAGPYTIVVVTYVDRTYPVNVLLIDRRRRHRVVAAVYPFSPANRNRSVSELLVDLARPRYTAGPRRRGKPKHSHRGHPVPGPGNVAAKRCASEKRAF